MRDNIKFAVCSNPRKTNRVISGLHVLRRSGFESRNFHHRLLSFSLH